MSTTTIATALKDSKLEQKEITDLLANKAGGTDKAIQLLERQLGKDAPELKPDMSPDQKLAALFKAYLEKQGVTVKNDPAKGELTFEAKNSDKVKKALEELAKASEVTNLSRFQESLKTGARAFTDAYNKTAGSRA